MLSTGKVLALSGLASLIAFSALCFALLYQGRTDGKVVEVIIPTGTSLAKVADLLHARAVIEKPALFKLILRFSGGTSRVRAGEFRFREGMRAIDALGVLYRSDPIVYQITIPEGWTVRQISDLLAAQNLVDGAKFLDLTLSETAAKKFGILAPSLEGFLYPDTYDFSKIDREERIIERMVDHFLKLYAKELKAEAEAKKISMFDLVTFASIVEKETGVGAERGLVSSVFHNRLKKKMRLQSDPTTIYGIPNFNGNLTRADLQSYSPYNTYVITGLPKGPIANPGLASLKASLNPTPSQYLFFVATGAGKHVFSETYEQHARYVDTYQKKRSGPK